MPKKGVTTGNLKMRSGPGTEYEPPIAILEPNTEVEVLAEEGEWLRVRFKGKEGYVGHKYVKVSEALSALEGEKKAGASMARRTSHLGFPQKVATSSNRTSPVRTAASPCE